MEGCKPRRLHIRQLPLNRGEGQWLNVEGGQYDVEKGCVEEGAECPPSDY